MMTIQFLHTGNQAVHKQSTLSGFTLIEMLIALVILSIGLLGVAALQTRGQQYTYEAYLLTQITVQGYQIMDNIRENGNFSRQDVLDNGTDDGTGYIVSSKPGGTVDCVTAACSVEDLRTFHLQQWFDALATNLPEGTAKITASVVNPSVVQYDIEITWSLREGLRGESNENTKTESWSMQL